MAPKVHDFTGRRFGRLVVTHRYAGPASDTKWVCQCDCGNSSTPFASALRKGETKSCGCLQRELQSERAKIGAFRRVHGMTDTPVHRVWRSMFSRCYNSSVRSYPRYGGRGIVVCERWLKFENFISDMGERPSSRHSIERKNNDGNYEPSNCHWATSEEQSYNKANTVLIEYDGAMITTLQASKITGLSKSTITNRRSRGWSDKEIIETPK